MLEQASGFAPSGVTKILVLFGIGLAIGNALGGKLADRGVMRALTGVFVVLVAIMVVFSRTMHHPVASVLTIFVWGVAAFATVPACRCAS